MKACVCALAALVVSACFRPAYDRPACGPHGECPDGLTCNAVLICDQGATLADGGTSVPVDGLVGAISDACAGTFSGQVDTCQLSLGSDVTLDGGAITYDTGTHELMGSRATTTVMHAILATKGMTVDAILAHDFHLTANSVLRATGSSPFAIIASGTITIDTGAVIDVSAGGAGARQSCSAPAGTGVKDTSGGSGGGGGGYSGAGGNGEKGDNDMTPVNGGTGSGAQGRPAGPSSGCAGAKGGDGLSGGGAGGLGGGALYLVSASRISLGSAAILNASGGGGKGGSFPAAGSGFAGGGGGGSGGMIWLEAPQVLASGGQLIANGGGGGEGSGVAAAGQDGQSGTSLAPAQGGANSSADGGDGGNGGASGHVDGFDATDLRPNGGGGGGGGVGYIHVVSPDQQIGATSPPPI